MESLNPYLDIALRSLAVYAFMLVAIRLTGKKEFSQLNTIDVVLILLISNAVQNAMVGNNTSLLGGIAAATVLFILNFLLKKLMFNSKLAREIISQHPEILIHDGKLNFEKLSKLGISDDELKEAMRAHGVEHYREVKLAIFEVDGNISIITGSGQLKQTHYQRKKTQKALGTMI
jgi:uncharacterized membrane protein YcaP (DUF421 family)